MIIRADLHVHTDASPDGLITPAGLVHLCRKRGLSAVAVTDHNRLTGALATARLAPAELRVVVGEEVRSRHGEMLGLFLQEVILPGLDALETAHLIHAQGGLVGVPHPMDRCRSAVDLDAMEALRRASLLDFVEARNGRVLRPLYNRQAEEWARRLGLPCSAGSDAHGPAELGTCSVLLADFAGPQEFLAALRQGRLQGRPGSFWVHMAISMRARLRRRRR